MIRAALLSLLLLPSLAVAQAAQAQVTDDAGLKAVAETIPATLGGIPGEWADMRSIDPHALQMRYMSKEGMGPSIGVTLHRRDSFDWTARRDGFRKMYEGPFLQIVHEGTFKAPNRPGTDSFFGEYSTQLGVRQIWQLRNDGIEISVLVIIFRKEDRVPMLKAVSDELFGGAAFVSGPPPIKLN